MSNHDWRKVAAEIEAGNIKNSYCWWPSNTEPAIRIPHIYTERPEGCTCRCCEAATKAEEKVARKFTPAWLKGQHQELEEAKSEGRVELPRCSHIETDDAGSFQCYSVPLSGTPLCPKHTDEARQATVMKFKGPMGPMQWEKLRETRRDIPDETWKNILHHASAEYRRAKEAWDAANIPAGTPEEIEAADYSSDPVFMDRLRWGIEAYDRNKASTETFLASADKFYTRDENGDELEFKCLAPEPGFTALTEHGFGTNMNRYQAQALYEWLGRRLSELPAGELTGNHPNPPIQDPGKVDKK